MSRQEGGYVYVLENESFPGMVKIGMTRQGDVKKRVAQMSTGVPTKFSIAYKAKVSNPEIVEKKLHDNFDDSRVPGKEWFKLSPKEVRQKLREVNEQVKHREDVIQAASEYRNVLDKYDRKNRKQFLASVSIIAFFIIFLLEGFVNAILLSFGAIPFLLLVSGFILIKVNRWRFQEELEASLEEIADKHKLNPDEIKEVSGSREFKYLHAANKRGSER